MKIKGHLALAPSSTPPKLTSFVRVPWYAYHLQETLPGALLIKAISYLITRLYLFYPQSSLLQWSLGQPVNRQSLNNAIKLLAQNVGLNEDKFSTYSFRIGVATTASAAGVPDCLICTLGCWSSDVYQLYVQTPDSTLDDITSSLSSYGRQTHLWAHRVTLSTHAYSIIIVIWMYNQLLVLCVFLMCRYN